jgi:HEAT repeat protein
LPEVVSVLVSFLESKDQRVELPRVVYALGLVGDRRSIAVLVCSLTDSDYLVRKEAAAALGRLRYPEAVVPLCKAALEDEAVNVRANAVVALGRLADPRAMSCLKRAADDPDDFVARLARDALPRLDEGK